jgi:hypothetical protein
VKYAKAGRLHYATNALCVDCGDALRKRGAIRCKPCAGKARRSRPALTCIVCGGERSSGSTSGRCWICHVKTLSGRPGRSVASTHPWRAREQ